MALASAASCLFGCVTPQNVSTQHIDTTTIHSPDATRIWIIMRRANGDDQVYYCTAGAQPDTGDTAVCVKAYPERVLARPE